MADVRTHYLGMGPSLLLKTGQETSYYAGDDGDLELGILESFTVKTTGDQSGTTNITLNGKTHALSNNTVKDNNTNLEWVRYVPLADIGPAADGKLFWRQWILAAESCTFNAAAKTVTAAVGTPFNTSTLCVGRKVDLTGTANNNIEITVAAAANNVITTVENLVNEGPVDTTFATKDDLVWDFIAQANTNSLGGYSDWRLPNYYELASLVDLGRHSPCINVTAFPSTPSAYHWTSSTRPDNTDSVFSMYFVNGYMSHGFSAVTKWNVRLVRG